MRKRTVALEVRQLESVLVVLDSSGGEETLDPGAKTDFREDNVARSRSKVEVSAYVLQYSVLTEASSQYHS
jgi:hypothetical protein